jgi:pyridoxine kinase
MPVVLILGSHVASSRVGGSLANLTLALSPFDIEPIHVPTTLLGRHPGWGPPGGGAVSDALFAGMLEGIAANGHYGGIDGVLTNYFATPAQIEIAARTIDAVKAANPRAIIVVDPVMGDRPDGLYVQEEVAAHLIEYLAPRADFLTPNAWELARITELPTDNLGQIRYAARTCGKPTLVTSVRDGCQIGGMFVDGNSLILGLHDEVATAPKGTGDVLATFFLGHLLARAVPRHAMARALAGTSMLVDDAARWGTSDLPIIASARAAWACAPLPLSDLT